jgi:succinate--hydroxymethylglutarate CoA-transferase
VTTIKHPALGDIRGIECPIKVSGVDERDHLAPPMLGQHTDQVLRELLGYTDERLEALRQEAMAAREAGSRGHSRM